MHGRVRAYRSAIDDGLGDRREAVGQEGATAAQRRNKERKGFKLKDIWLILLPILAAHQ